MPLLPPYVRLAFDYGETLDRGVIRTDMDGGIAKQRPRYSRAIRTRHVKLVVLSLADKLAFDRWWDTELNGGAEWFTYPDPLRGGTETARFVTASLAWRAVNRDVWEAQSDIESLGGL
ncbi:hypothetical protein NF212_06540 [Parasalinivibrio latis]|uniref:hypothetical protein n=1 Tax=Parasalinivibrio latis TaxID=2952610 RepID=UPI0030DE7B9F